MEERRSGEARAGVGGGTSEWAIYSSGVARMKFGGRDNLSVRNGGVGEEAVLHAKGLAHIG
jgi:hypothetical protein